LAAAKRLGRRYLGIELSTEYAERVRQRLAEIEEARKQA
jgi:DNA modification methylase